MLLAADVAGTATCPQPDAVAQAWRAAQTDALTAERWLARVDAGEAAGSTRLRLFTGDGREVASRELPADRPCDELAQTAAVLLSAWQAQLSTSLHLHPVPMFAYILEGQLLVDYEGVGEKRYRKGDVFVEAIDVAHRGRAAIRGNARKVKILVVYAGAVGTPNSEVIEP